MDKEAVKLIRKIRIEKNYSQEYLASKLNISQSYYGRIENGKTSLNLKTLKEIKVLYPNITQIEAGAINYSLLMESNIDNKKIFLIKSNNDFSENEKNLIKEWLTVKLESNVEVFFTKN